MNNISLLRLITAEESTPLAGVFMTYGFDAELFEKHILPAFLGVAGNSNETKKNEFRFRYNIASMLRSVPVAVLSDAEQYHGGQSFLYDHITIKNKTFHPKFHLLLFPDRLRVIVGSCNITKPGICYNAETVWYKDIEAGETTGLAADIKVALTQIINLARQENSALDSIFAITEILTFLESCQHSKAMPRLINTLNNQSVFDRYFKLLRSIPGTCESLSIISPFYESDSQQAMETGLMTSFTAKFFEAYPKAKLKIYFPALKDKETSLYKVKAPVNILTKLTSKYPNIQLWALTGLWLKEEGSSEVVPRALHAKLLIADFSNQKRLILSGSINFTNNAMRSNWPSLRNVEIGVVDYGKIQFALPKACMVSAKYLSYIEPEEVVAPANIFIEAAVYDKGLLTLTLTAKAPTSFSITYQKQTIYTTEDGTNGSNSISIPFKIKHDMAIRVATDTTEFYCPITIINKMGFIPEELTQGITNKLQFDDVIALLAGSYSSLTELARRKEFHEPQVDTPDETAETAKGCGTTASRSVYFRHNLQLYYKALSTLRNDLQEPFYSSFGFLSYIRDPLGLTGIVNFIEADYKNGQIGKSEAFILIIELENIIYHLQFKKDRVMPSFKSDNLQALIEPVVLLRRKIYQEAASNTILRWQYNSLLTEYGVSK